MPVKMGFQKITTIGTSMIRTLKVVWFSSFANCHCLNFLIQDQYIHILPDGQNTSNFKILGNIFKLAHFKFLVQLMGAFQNTGANLQVPSDGFSPSAGCKFSDFVRFSDDCVLEVGFNYIPVRNIKNSTLHMEAVDMMRVCILPE